MAQLLSPPLTPPRPTPQSGSCDPNQKKPDMVLEAGESTMKLLRGAYSCITLVKGVGLVAFRDPHGIR